MPIVEYKNDWTSYQVITRIKIDDNHKRIWSYAVEIYPQDEDTEAQTKLTEVFIEPEHRNQGLSHEMLSDALEIITAQGKDNYLIVKKDYFAIKLYEKYGYKYHSDYDNEFNWMELKIRTNE